MLDFAVKKREGGGSGGEGSGVTGGVGWLIGEAENWSSSNGELKKNELYQKFKIMQLYEIKN